MNQTVNMTKHAGHELKVDQLRIGGAYVLHKPTWGHSYLMRCAAITKRGAVGFYSVTPAFTTVLTRRLDGTLADGAGAQVHVYEYLGEDDQPPEGQAA